MTTVTEALTNAVRANKEENELESLVSVLGDKTAQQAARSHTLPELVASEQGHGMDYLNGALNRRAA